MPLPSPVPPHGEIALDIAFHAKLPRVFARTGYVRDYFLVGQWYPKIGVYEPAGLRGRAAGGWNCHAFHANSEFYADYGRFDVTMTVPSRFVVGATGKRVSEKAQGDRTSYRYVQDDVHDFAWTADPRFVVVEFPFDPAHDVPAGWSAQAAKELGMTEAEIALKPVSCRLLLQPGHMRAKERYLRSTREAISFYGLWFGAYPYETLTVVDPPDDAEGSGGMEYPTFITGGEADAWLTRWPFDKVRGVEIVTLHEFGHQYWYGMVGSNEFEESWLDEGLNTDSEYRAMGMAYGPRDTAQFPGGVGTDAYSLAHAEYRHLTNLDPIHALRVVLRVRQSSYVVNSYPKVGLFMAQLKHDLGRRRLRPRAEGVLPGMVVPPSGHEGLLRRLRTRVRARSLDLSAQHRRRPGAPGLAGRHREELEAATATTGSSSTTGRRTLSKTASSSAAPRERCRRGSTAPSSSSATRATGIMTRKRAWSSPTAR